MDNDRLIVRTAMALDFGEDVEAIRVRLLGEGLSEYDAFLTFRAGQILSQFHKPGCKDCQAK